MPHLEIIELKLADVFEDMVRVHHKHRNGVPAGRVCKVTYADKSVLLVARGSRRNQSDSFAVDLRTRNRLGISKYNQTVDVKFEAANWIDEVRWGLSASEPISRIATRLAVISVALGLLGAVLGAISLFG